MSTYHCDKAPTWFLPFTGGLVVPDRDQPELASLYLIWIETESFLFHLSNRKKRGLTRFRRLRRTVALST
jgi:hypothetical protein